MCGKSKPLYISTNWTSEKCWCSLSTCQLSTYYMPSPILSKGDTKKTIRAWFSGRSPLRWMISQSAVQRGLIRMPCCWGRRLPGLRRYWIRISVRRPSNLLLTEFPRVLRHTENPCQRPRQRQVSAVTEWWVQYWSRLLLRGSRGSSGGKWCLSRGW